MACSFMVLHADVTVYYDTTHSLYVICKYVLRVFEESLELLIDVRIA